MNLLHSTCALLLLLSPFALQAEETSSLEGKPICTRPFPLQLTNYTFSSSHGEIAVWDSGGPGTAVLLIHGNSSCKEIFTHQMHSSLTEKYRFIAIDLPGHGNSIQATDVVMELIEKLHLENPFIVGWSLGDFKYKNLFSDKIYEIPEGGHAVFWEKPESFNAILEKFLNKESNMEKKHS